MVLTVSETLIDRYNYSKSKLGYNLGDFIKL